MELLELGRVLRERREAIGTPKAEIARRAEVSDSYVVMVEQGSRRASKAVLQRWAAALGWDEASTRQVLTMAGHTTQEQDSTPLPRSALTSGALHFPQPRRMERERVIQELLGVLNRAEESEQDWHETLKLLGSFLGWLKFRLDDLQSFAKRLYFQITGPASEVQSIFDEVEAGKHRDLKVASALQEYTEIFTRQTLGYEAKLQGVVVFTSNMEDKPAHDYLKRLIETRFPQSHIEVKVSEEDGSL